MYGKHQTPCSQQVRRVACGLGQMGLGWPAGRLRLMGAGAAPGRYDGKGCFSNEANQGCSWVRIILLVLAGMAPPLWAVVKGRHLGCLRVLLLGKK